MFQESFEMDINDRRGVILIHDPIIYDEQSAEEKLKKNISKYYKNSYNRTFGQILQDRILFFDKNQNIWENFIRPTILDKVKENSSWENRETNIEIRLKLYKELNQKLGNITFSNLPVGQLSLTCNFDRNVPFIFTLSNRTDGYFDTLILPEELTDYDKLMNYDNRTSGTLPYNHSGDIQEKMSSLLQHISFKNVANKNEYRQYTGYVVLVGYNKMSFIALKKSEPNICIVDKKENDQESNIWIYNFPITEDFVGEANVAFAAKFICYPMEKKIEWLFTQQPLFSKDKLNVSDKFRLYKPDFLRFKNNLDSELRLNSESIVVDNDNYDDYFTHDFKKIKLNPVNVLMIQEPILRGKNRDLITTFIKRISDIMNCKMYTFHQNIKPYNDQFSLTKNNKDVGFDDCSASLPIGGGSVISEHSLLKISKPMENSEIAREFTSDIENSKKIIMIVSSDYNIANAPKIFSKINAKFIVVNNDESQDTNISLALLHQGPLSTIYTYFPSENKLIFVRGLGNKTYGDRVNLDDIIFGSDWPINHEISIPAFPQSTNEQNIYDQSGNKLFCVNTTTVDQADTILIHIENFIRHIYNKYSEEIVTLKLKWILGQLEVIVNANVFKNMIKLIEKKLSVITKGEAFQILIKQHILKTNIANERDTTPYDSKWLYNFMMKNLPKSEDHYQVMEKYLMIKRAIDDLNVSKNLIYNKILENLNHCVSTKSSYGTHKRDAEKMSKIRSNVLSVKWLSSEDRDKVLSNLCSQEGALIYEFDPNIFKQVLKDFNYSRESILSVDDRFREAPSDLVDAFLVRYSEENDNMNALIFEYESRNENKYFYSNETMNQEMVVIPILDEFKDIMKNDESITKYNWTKPILNGHIDFIRIMLRTTVSHLIYKHTGEKYDGGHPVVGRMVLRLLFDAMLKLRGKANLQNATANDGLIIKLRGLMGLIISVMASGVDKPLSSVYQIFLYKNLEKLPRIDLPDDTYFFEKMIEYWSWLKLDEIPVKTRGIEFINNKIKNIITDVVVKEIDMKTMKRNKIILLIKMKNWYYNTIRPLIEMIYNHGYAQRLRIDLNKYNAKFSTYKKPKKIMNGNKFLLLPQNNDCYSSEIFYTDNELEEIENKMLNYIKEYYQEEQSIRKKTVSNMIGTYDSNFIHEVLEYYNRHIKVNNLRKKSKLLQSIEELENIIKEGWRGEKIQQKWNFIQTISYDNYIKKSALLRIFTEPIILKLNEILTSSENIDEELKSLRQLRARLFTVYFKFSNNYQPGGYLPKAIKALSKCETKNDFIDVYTHLSNYLYDSNEGHFCNVYQTENTEIEEKIKNEIKAKEIKIFDEIKKNNVNVNHLFNLYEKVSDTPPTIQDIITDVVNQCFLK